MLTPDPTPTAAELVTAAQIMAVSIDTARAAIGANPDQEIVNGQWAITLTYIAQWNSFFAPGAKQTKKVGPIEWYQGKEVSELDFRNRLRLIYGFDPLLAVPGTAINEIIGSHHEHHESCGCNQLFNRVFRRPI